jgi:tellurite resistance protein TerC
VVAVLGSGVVVLGVALILVPVPGPAIILIPLGLAILAREFLWAQDLLQPVRKLLRRLKDGVQRVLGRPSPPADPEVNG